MPRRRRSVSSTIILGRNISYSDLYAQQDGIASHVLKNLGVELGKVRSTVEFIIGRGDRIVLGEISLTPRAKKIIELAVDEARQLNHPYIGTEHLLLGLVREGEGIAVGALESLGVSLVRVRAETLKVIKHEETPNEQEPPKPPSSEPPDAQNLVEITILHRQWAKCLSPPIKYNKSPSTKRWRMKCPLLTAKSYSF